MHLPLLYPELTVITDMTGVTGSYYYTMLVFKYYFMLNNTIKTY
jgi:hypothetical protein